MINRGQAGFTLIETIIYMAILSFIIGSGIATAFYLIDSAQKNKDDINIQAEGNFILGKIEWAMSGASAISVGATLSITKPGLPAAQNPLVFSWDGDSNFQLKRGAGTAQNLNSGNATTSGSFTDIPAVGGKPEGVSVNFTINNRPFTITKYLRK